MVTLISYYSDNVKYDKLLEVSINSFDYFHKNENFIIKSIKKEDLSNLGVREDLPAGVLKFKVAEKLAKETNADKIIILGADTIVCSRLDEFLEDNYHQVLATLDYAYKIPINIKNSNSQNHVNADVVCFNDVNVLSLLLAEYEKNPQLFGEYYEQGALNYILFSEKFNVSYKIVDSPYPESKISYNVRGKGYSFGLYGGVLNRLNYKDNISKYEVKNDKIYTMEGCQIKVFHYCQGLGSFENPEVEQIINCFIFEMFNEGSRNFFNKISNTNFFSKIFKI